MADEKYTGEAYCVKCREKRPLDGVVVEKNGRRMAQGLCPVCGKEKLVLLAYVYGDDLKNNNGRVWSLQTALRLAAAHAGSSCYVVEVCNACRWNHLSEAYTATAG